MLEPVQVAVVKLTPNGCLQPRALSVELKGCFGHVQPCESTNRQRPAMDGRVRAKRWSIYGAERSQIGGDQQQIREPREWLKQAAGPGLGCASRMARVPGGRDQAAVTLAEGGPATMALALRGWIDGRMVALPHPPGARVGFDPVGSARDQTTPDQLR